MKLLVACEESQRVCVAFREKGHEAYSCDLQACSGGHPEWHILGDALEALKGGSVVTADGMMHDVGRWDMLIAHPHVRPTGAGSGVFAERPEALLGRVCKRRKDPKPDFSCRGQSYGGAVGVIIFEM